MKIDPEVVKIDLMLAEFQALCYMRSQGARSAEQVDAYRRQIVEAVQAIKLGKEQPQ